MKAVQTQAEQQQVESGDVAEAQQSHDEALQELLLQVRVLTPQPGLASSPELYSALGTRL